MRRRIDPICAAVWGGILAGIAAFWTFVGTALWLVLR